MGREYKFRAFIDGKMVDADSLAFQEYEPLKAQLANCENIMQYTGINVKGVEVYEGDLLEFSQWNTKDGLSPMGNSGWKVSDVYFDNGKYVVRGSEFWDIFNFTNVTVIGNIYENPELLKKYK